MTMQQTVLLTWRWALPLAGVLLLQACTSTPPVAGDFGDNWKPVNTMAQTPKEVPSREEQAMHRFQLLPTDTSLRGLLERWAKENGGTLDWQYPGDLTLVATLEQAADNNLQRALTVVRRTYSPQRLRVQVLPDNGLLVTRLP